jgi:hypothetical protein
MNSKNIILILAIVLVLGAGGTAYYFYSQYHTAQNKLNNPNQVAQEETQALIDKMSKIIDLPKADIKGGEPTLATVLDKSKLKDQAFFASAENGDKVLIYTKAKKAFLYRPSTGKVVNVAPVSIGAGQQVNIAVVNGTTTADSGSKMSQTVKDKFASATIVSTENAAKSNYTKTVVVDLTGQNADAASTLATAIGGTVAQLPDGETKPTNADLLVIVGSDKK